MIVIGTPSMKKNIVSTSTGSPTLFNVVTTTSNKNAVSSNNLIQSKDLKNIEALAIAAIVVKPSDDTH